MTRQVNAVINSEQEEILTNVFGVIRFIYNAKCFENKNLTDITDNNDFVLKNTDQSLVEKVYNLACDGAYGNKLKKSVDMEFSFDSKLCNRDIYLDGVKNNPVARLDSDYISNNFCGKVKIKRLAKKNTYQFYID